MPNARTSTTPANHPLTDIGNAERFLELHGGRFLFCDDYDTWLAWDGRRWALDASRRLALHAAKDVCAVISREAESAATLNDRDALVRHAKASGQMQAVRNLLSAAAVDPRVVVGVDQLDRDPDVLTVENGVIDLRDGSLRGHSASELLTKMTRVRYQQDAKCPRFMQFLDEVFLADAEKIAFVQRCVGYSLTGHTSEQVMFLLNGAGSNGKTTLIEVLRKCLGDFATHTPADSLMQRRAGAPSNDIVRLRGARFVSAVETGEDQRLDESLIKSLTGGDRMTARQLYRDFIEFVPALKLWLATNHLPTINGTDEGIWRRLVVLEFERNFRPEERDPQLLQALECEREGILAWAIRGAAAWYARGLDVPESVSEAAGQYRRSQDTFGAFLVETCETDPSYVATNASLYAAYEGWARRNGEPPLSQQALGLRLQEKGFGTYRTANERGRRGLRVKPVSHSDAPD